MRVRDSVTVRVRVRVRVRVAVRDSASASASASVRVSVSVRWGEATSCVYDLIRPPSPAHSPAHPLARSPTRPLAHSPARPLARSPTRKLAACARIHLPTRRVHSQSDSSLISGLALRNGPRAAALRPAALRPCPLPRPGPPDDFQRIFRRMPPRSPRGHSATRPVHRRCHPAPKRRLGARRPCGRLLRQGVRRWQRTRVAWVVGVMVGSMARPTDGARVVALQLTLAAPPRLLLSRLLSRHLSRR